MQPTTRYVPSRGINATLSGMPCSISTHPSGSSPSMHTTAGSFPLAYQVTPSTTGSPSPRATAPALAYQQGHLVDHRPLDGHEGMGQRTQLVLGHGDGHPAAAHDRGEHRREAGPALHDGHPQAVVVLDRCARREHGHLQREVGVDQTACSTYTAPPLGVRYCMRVLVVSTTGAAVEVTDQPEVAQLLDRLVAGLEAHPGAVAEEVGELGGGVGRRLGARRTGDRHRRRGPAHERDDGRGAAFGRHDPGLHAGDVTAGAEEVGRMDDPGGDAIGRRR